MKYRFNISLLSASYPLSPRRKIIKIKLDDQCGIVTVTTLVASTISNLQLKHSFCKFSILVCRISDLGIEISTKRLAKINKAK